jgi:transcriptional regulator with XRE-family HTH domain
MGYRGKLEQQERARALRAQAWTLQEIADELGVAKSSVSLWVRDVDFVPRPRRTARRRGPNALQRRKQEEIDRLLREGRERIGRLTNTNPLIIGFFCAWLRHFFEVDERRLRVTLYLHEGLDLEEATRFWVCVTGIPPDQFSKPYRAEADATMRHTKHHNGCPAVAYGCSRTHRAIMGLVHALIGGDVLPEMCGEAGR